MRPFKFFFPVLVITILFSCSNPAKNDNAIFTDNEPSTNEYKSELIRQINSENQGKVRYFLEGLKVVQDTGYLEVLVEGRNLQAKGLILVNNWNGLQDVKKTVGVGYRGAELLNLRVEPVKTGSDIILIYKGVDRIIDYVS